MVVAESPLPLWLWGKHLEVNNFNQSQQVPPDLWFPSRLFQRSVKPSRFCTVWVDHRARSELPLLFIYREPLMIFNQTRSTPSWRALDLCCSGTHSNTSAAGAASSVIRWRAVGARQLRWRGSTNYSTTRARTGRLDEPHEGRNGEPKRSWCGGDDGNERFKPVCDPGSEKVEMLDF